MTDEIKTLKDPSKVDQKLVENVFLPISSRIETLTSQEDRDLARELFLKCIEQLDKMDANATITPEPILPVETPTPSAMPETPTSASSLEPITPKSISEIKPEILSPPKSDPAPTVTPEPVAEAPVQSVTVEPVAAIAIPTPPPEPGVYPAVSAPPSNEVQAVERVVAKLDMDKMSYTIGRTTAEVTPDIDLTNFATPQVDAQGNGVSESPISRKSATLLNKGNSWQLQVDTPKGVKVNGNQIPLNTIRPIQTGDKLTFGNNVTLELRQTDGEYKLVKV
jgi:hypothetical protein